MQDRTSLILHQKVKTREERLFELKSGRELHIVHTKNHNTLKYAFSVLAMREQAKRMYKFKKRWLVLALGATAAMFLFPRMQQAFFPGTEHYALSILSGLFFSAVLFFMLLLRTFRRRDTFYSVHTRLPLVEFWVNKPSRREYRRFIEVLKERIRQHRQEMNIDYNRQLAGELRTLRRITEAGLLSESVYLAAKAKLLLMSDMPYRPPKG